MYGRPYTFLHTQICTYVRDYVRTYARLCVRTYVHTYELQPSCLFFGANQITCLCTYLGQLPNAFELLPDSKAIATYVRKYIHTNVTTYIAVTNSSLYLCTYLRRYLCSYQCMYLRTNFNPVVCFSLQNKLHAYVHTLVEHAVGSTTKYLLLLL